jgi:hypothetical protein
LIYARLAVEGISCEIVDNVPEKTGANRKPAPFLTPANVTNLKTKYLFTPYFILVFALATFQTALTLEKDRTGTIRGSVTDSETKTLLPGTNVVIVGTPMGSATDAEGKFIVQKVPVGNYTLEFRIIGYEPLRKTDIIVKSERSTIVQAELKMTLIETQGVEVTGGYFSQSEEQPTSLVNFSSEEIRRAPGSAGDISRILMGLPSLAKVNDQSNSLFVRGGSPVENAFFIDNIEIPNINHFPSQGSSGGPIGLLNVDLIENVNFYTGGFSSIYGDKLSSVMDVTFREGNRDEVDVQAELSFAGIGAVAEGPLLDKKGSWLLSARRSYVDLLLDAVGANSVAVQYGDYQGKFVYDLDPTNTMTMMFVSGYDHSEADKHNGEVIYGSNNVWENTLGMNWRSLWGKDGYSNASVALTSTQFHDDFYETGTDIYFMKNRSIERTLTLRNVNYYRLSESQRLESGFEAKYLFNVYDNYLAATSDALGTTVSALSVNKNVGANKFGAFASFIWSPFNALTTTMGLRFDYFSYNQKSHVSPRLSLSFKIDERASVNGSTGIFYQSLPLTILSQNGANKNLREPVAYHYVLGITRLLTENTKLTIEVYDKEYDNFPLDRLSPPLFILDESVYRYGFFSNHGQLTDNGKAFARGIEFMIQKKLAEEVYGLLSGSYFNARYRGYDSVWRDRVFDNRFMVSIEGGYKPNDEWEFSLRWIYAGGPPYTPFDEASSKLQNAGVFELARINDARQADYHSLNIRFDKRFHFEHSNFILYFSIWNLYDRKNVASYYWNKNKNEQDTLYQWGMLPVLGLEYDF